MSFRNPKSFIRTKTIWCNRQKNRKALYLESDIYPMTEVEQSTRPRKKKEKLSKPKQQSLNDRRARRFFGLLVKSNFVAKDILLTLSYDDEHMPESAEQANKEMRNYMRRLSRAYKAKGLEFKYLNVTECSKKGRYHHHILINQGLDRDEIEAMWSKKHKRIGLANTKRIKLDAGSLDAISKYMTKEPQGKKRWCGSRNLQRPDVTPSDTKISKKKYHQLAQLPEDKEMVRAYFENLYPGYELTDYEKFYNEVTSSWILRAKMQLSKLPSS